MNNLEAAELTECKRNKNYVAKGDEHFNWKSKK